MEVEFNPGLNVNPVTGPSVARQQNTTPADTNMSFERTQSLQKTMQDTSPVRPAAVTQASALISDDSYPSDELLGKMAGLLADKIGSASDSLN